MANLKIGSSGEDVKKLQQALIKENYGDYLGNSKDDGIFGKNTETAVRKYQEANGLDVDGIAGEQTLGKLYGTSADSGATNNLSAVDPSAAGTGGSWQDKADDYLRRYESRAPFSYDVNMDALYDQYKDQYIRQGQMAMEDAMGQAATMTGGYGNSYAQSVGQQAYDQQMRQLNGIIPELYGIAYDRHQQEGEDMLAMYDLYTGRAAQEAEKESAAKKQSVEPEYTTYDAEARNTWRKLFEEGTEISHLDAVARDMKYAGYDPALVEDLYTQFAKKMLGNTAGAPPVFDEKLFEGWTADEWQAYFDAVKSTEGEAAMLEALRELVNAGMVSSKDLYDTELIQHAMDFMRA